MLLPDTPWKQLQALFTLRGNHMTASVENINKWAYFAQNIGWLISIPVALTLIYSSLSNRVDAQEKEITQLRSQVSDINTSLTQITKQQQDELVVLTEIKTTISDEKKGPTHGQASQP